MLSTAETEVANVESIFKPTFVLMGGRVVGFVATFLIPVVLVRAFTPEQFGTYKQVFLIYATLYGIAQLGMAESLFYFLPRDPHNGGRYVLNSLIILLIAGAGCVALLAGTGGKIPALLSNRILGPYLLMLGAFLLLMLASSALEIVLISRKRYRWAAGSYAFSDLLRASFFLLPVLVWRDLRALLVGGLIFAGLRLGTSVLYFKREFVEDLRPDFGVLRRQIAYVLPFELAIILEVVQANFHQYAVSHYFNAATFAIYSVGCLQIPLIDFLGSPACNVMMVLMSEQIREGRNRAVVLLWHETTRKLALIFFPLAGLLIVSARNLIAFLFTEKYLASVPIFMIWSSTIVFSALQTDGILRVFAATRFLLFLNVIRFMVVAGLIAVAISHFGLIGAVLVTALAMGIAKALSLSKIRKLIGVPASGLLPWKTLAAIAAVAILACGGPWAIQATLKLPALLLLAISGLAYAALYLALLQQFNLLNESERSALFGWIRPLEVPTLETARESEDLGV